MCEYRDVSKMPDDLTHLCQGRKSYGHSHRLVLIVGGLATDTQLEATVRTVGEMKLEKDTECLHCQLRTADGGEGGEAL